MAYRALIVTTALLAASAAHAQLPWETPLKLVPPDEPVAETQIDETPAAAAGALPWETPLVLTPPQEPEPADAPPPLVTDEPSSLPEMAATPPSPAPRVLDAPSHATPPTDSFTDALVSAYSNNPQLKAARESLKAVDEGVAEAISGFRPTLVGDYEKGRRRRRQGANDWTYTDTASKQLTVDQPLFQGGETLAEIKAAKARVKAERARLLAVEQNVLLQAVIAYVDLTEKAAVLDLSRKNLEVLARHREEASARFDAGDLTRTDVVQADARYARAQADMEQAEGNLSAARAAFIRVIGFAPGVYAVPEALPALPATLEEATQAALAVEPGLREAQYLEKALDSEIDINTAQLLPNVSLRGTVERTEGSSIPGIGNIDQDALTLNVNVPLYQSGAEYARLRAAKKRYQEARYVTVDARDAAVQTAMQAWYDYQAALAVVTSSQAAVEAATGALEGVQEEYTTGQRTTLDVLDAEQEFFTNQVELVRARRMRIELAYRLLASAGRLTAKELALPVEIYDPIAHYDDVKWLPLGF